MKPLPPSREPERKQAYNAAYRAANRDKVNAKKREYAKANKVQLAQVHKDWIASWSVEQREAHKAKCKARYQAHRDEELANRKRRYDTDPAYREGQQRRSKDIKLRHRQRVRCRNAAARPMLACDNCGKQFKSKMKSHRFCSLVCNHKFNSQYHGAWRKAQHLCADGWITKEQWRDLLAYFDWRCAYCGERKRVVTIDHVEPLSRRGSHDISNLVPACKSCNCSKHDYNLIEYLYLRPRGYKKVRVWRRKGTQNENPRPAAKRGEDDKPLYDND